VRLKTKPDKKTYEKKQKLNIHLTNLTIQFILKKGKFANISPFIQKNQTKKSYPLFRWLSTDLST